MARPTSALRDFLGGSGWSFVGIIVLCAVLIPLRWAKMDSLYNIDPSMWLAQIGRFAQGEIPYRDFSWNYPPLAIFLLGWLARAFGPTFGVIQAAMDVISIAVVLLSWWLVRYLLPPSSRFVTVAGVVVIGSTSLTKFSFFTFSTYSPSLEIAAAGLLMLMIGGVRQLHRPTNSRADFGLISGGVFIATVTRPEAMVAAWGAFVLLWMLDRSRRLKWYAAIFGAAAIPSAAVYAALGSQVGFQQLKDGITGYGLASFACPWWPTGLGVFGAIGATGEAVFAATVLLWPFRGALRPEVRVHARRIWIAGWVSFFVFASYVWYQCGDVIMSGSPRSLKVEAVERAVVWTSPALLPVMWASILICVAVALRWRSLGTASRVMCFVLAVPVIMSARSLFGTTLFPYTEVSAMCYPFFVVAAAYLIEALYDSALARRTAAAAIAISILLGGYSVLRLIVAYPAQLSNKPYYALQTNAGTVRLSDDHISEQIFSYIVTHASPTDTLLDLPYGGGFNFATRLRSPAFTTQFRQLRMPLAYQLRDLDAVRKTPPAIVIADHGTHFQSELGYEGNMTCPFPRLVWAPTEPSWDPGYVFPVVSYIEQNYGVVIEIGPKLILGQLEQLR